MDSRCKPCAGLSMSLLVSLAEKEFNGDHFPYRAFYSHHKSFDDLEQSAESGCAFCQLVLQCFKGTPADPGISTIWPNRWQGTKCDIGTSAYSIAKKLDKSDVKIALGVKQQGSFSTYVPLSSIGAFDSLMVQVGPQDIDMGYDEENLDSTLSALSLTLTTSPDTPVYIKRFRVGRFRLDSNLGSQANHAMARSWLSECRKWHFYCHSTEIVYLPTRVIDVEAIDDSQVRVVQLPGVQAEYATLSHCWGGPISPVLTTQTLSDFQNGLSVDTLPANFQDAITITRELELKYLWIDSLCILQDSKEDWEVESKKMGELYLNSKVNISAMNSKGSKSGILRSEPDVVLDPKPAHLQAFPDDPAGVVVQVERQNIMEEHIRGLDMYSPLSKRAWTLQESILPRKHLCYGEKQIYWRCLGGYKSSDGLLDENARDYRPPADTYSHLLKAIQEGILGGLFLTSQTLPMEAERRAVLDQYYKLVEAYTYRNLTFDFDKLPAFSGVAQRLHAVLGGDYLAGLWSKDLHRGLLWTLQVGNLHHVEQYQAPTWSWAVTNQQISYASPRKLVPSNTQLQLLDSIITPRNEANPYGEITSARLVVKGLTMPLIRTNEVFDGVPAVQVGQGSWDRQEGSFTYPWEPGRPMGVVTKQRDGGHYYLFSYLSTQHSMSRAKSPPSANLGIVAPGDHIIILVQLDEDSCGACLVLKLVAGSESTYERAGLLDVAKDGIEKLPWIERTLSLV